MSNLTTPEPQQDRRWQPTPGSESTKIGSENGWNLAGAAPGSPSTRQRKKRVPWEAPEGKESASKKGKSSRSVAGVEKAVQFTQLSDGQFFKNIFKLCRLQKETKSSGTGSNSFLTFETIVVHQNDVKLRDFARAVVHEYIRSCRLPPETFSETDTWLTEDRLMLLDQINFPWPKETQRSSSPDPIMMEKVFQERVQHLVRYKKEHGDLLVPFDYHDQDFFQWMEQIREDDVLLQGGKPTLPAQTKTKTGLNQERRDLLAALGFDFIFDQILQKRLRDLQNFHSEQQEKENKKTSGNSGIYTPSSHAGPLGKWCSRMRSYHRQLRMGTFERSDRDRERTEQRIEHLKKIGVFFDDNPQQVVSWEERFQQLLEFKERHGHCNCPQHWSENKDLGKWVNSQRRNHNDKKMAQDRIDKLEAVGFVWKLRDRFFDRDWQERLVSLRTYQQEHQHCNVPSPWPEDPLLSKWVTRAREEYRKYKKGKASKLTEERIQQLDELGFQWDQPQCQTMDETST